MTQSGRSKFSKVFLSERELRLHRIKIIETGDHSTARLFGLCLGLLACARKGHWPSVVTANSLFRRGFDDGELAMFAADLARRDPQTALGAASNDRIRVNADRPFFARLVRDF